MKQESWHHGYEQQRDLENLAYFPPSRVPFGKKIALTSVYIKP